MNVRMISQLYEEYAVLPNIRRHMKMVASIAVAFGRLINKKNQKSPVDIKLVRHAALLHDLLKVCDFSLNDAIFIDDKYSTAQKQIWRKIIKLYGGMGHIKAASDLLQKIGEPELANLVKKHDYACVIAKDPSDRPHTVQEKIIYYADKRVLHDKLVDMKTRFTDGKKRYADSELQKSSRLEIEKKAFQIEKELCRQAGIAPHDLEQLIFQS